MKKLLNLILFLFVFLSFSLNLLSRFGGGTGSYEEPYRIYTREHLEEINTTPNSEIVSKYFILMNDITDSLRTVIKCDGFSGIFDGQNHKITLALDNSNCINFVNHSDYCGLFGDISGPSAHIKNVIVDGSIKIIYNNSHHSANDYYCVVYAGGIVGFGGSGIIENCVNMTDIYYNIDTVRKSVKIGGIVGYLLGSVVKNCVNIGKLEATNLPRYNGILSLFIAGIIGGNHNFSSYMSISNCINLGTIIVDDFAIVSGIVSHKHYGTDIKLVENCINAGTIIVRTSGKSTTISGINTIDNDYGLITKKCINTGVLIGGDSSKVGGIVAEWEE